MCVDDYQFRHYSAIQSKQCRRFIFINEDDIQKTFLVNISQFQEDGQIALGKIINHLSSKGLLASKRTFFWPKYNMKIKYGDICKVPFQTLFQKQIIFRAQIAEENQENFKYWSGFSYFNCLNDQISDKKEQNNFASIDSKKIQELNQDEVLNKSQATTNCYLKFQQNDTIEKKNEKKDLKRSKQSQRSIFEVLFALKKWRKLYDTKKMNLTKAANLIGISKKSLDDYYIVVRIGQVLNFDFQSNLNGKMGDLRSFIKKSEKKVSGKLTKEVKCFELLPDIDIDNLVEVNQKSFKQTSQNIEDQQREI